MKLVKIIGTVGFFLILFISNAIAVALWPFMLPGWSLPDKDLRFFLIFFSPVFSFGTTILLFLPISRSLKVLMGAISMAMSLVVLIAYFS